MTGPLLFARYAFPPNERGLCGPADNAALRGYAMASETDPGLVRLARGFAGAWPYLQLIAAANGIADPLDTRVVEAYWIGNGLLDSVRVADYGAFLDDRFRRQAGRGWASIAAAIPAGALPHHSFHVFCVYPWTGLLREGRAEPSLHVLDSCRISWGWVVTTDPLVVARRPLTWDGRLLALGPPGPCQVAAGFVTGLRYGDWVSVHWNSVCDRLTPSQLLALRRYSTHHLRLANSPIYARLAEARLSVYSGPHRGGAMRKALRWSVPICALAGSLAVAVPGTASAAPGGGAGTWAVAPAFSGRLYGVAAISDRDVWAVGLGGSGSLIVHWNGTSWS